MTEPNTIDHEVRIRMLEKNTQEVTKSLKEISTEFREQFTELRKEIKSQFHWTLGMAFGLIGIVILPVVTAEILGIIKTIQNWGG